MISYCSHRHSSVDVHAPALEARDVSVYYRDSAKPALKEFNALVAAGTALALVGANGAGKSTLFKAISGLMPVNSGTIRVFGHPLGACHHKVVYLPQRSEIDWLFPMTVEDLVLTGRYVYLGWLKNPGQKDKTIVQESLERLEIADLAKRQINQLSGGQQQRALIARALAQNADLFLLDEPLNAVDAATRQIVAEVLAHIKAQSKTVIVATHYYDQEEGIYDGAIYLKDGEEVLGKCC